MELFFLSSRFLELEEFNTKLLNRYFNLNHETPLNLQKYISIVNREVTELIKWLSNNK